MCTRTCCWDTNVPVCPKGTISQHHEFKLHDRTHLFHDRNVLLIITVFQAVRALLGLPVLYSFNRLASYIPDSVSNYG